MAGNSGLNRAAVAKKDEFYTQLTDIENELRHYTSHFHGKVVLCNCDDPYESNFFKYFALYFNTLKLKKLIATCYVSSPIMNTQLNLFDDPEADAPEENVKKPYKVEITEVTDLNGDGRADLADVELLLRNGKNTRSLLKGDGDFRSAECIELLKQADIVVTNPPFSLFREYVAQLIAYNKKFLIIGHQNATHYKEIFPLIMDNRVWLGYGFPGNVGFFASPYEDRAVSSQHKEGLIRVSGVMWFTNLDIKKRHEDMILYRNYTPEKYPSYTNYDAIEVGKVADIPCDYDGNMGVPDNFLQVYNPDQFEIVGLGFGDLGKKIGVQKNYRGRTDLAYLLNNTPKCPYSRIIVRVRKRQGENHDD